MVIMFSANFSLGCQAQKQLQKLKDEIWRKDNSFVSVCFPENTLEKKECNK